MNSEKDNSQENPISVVLVVDDDQITQKQVKLCLEKEKLQVITASDGIEGLNHYEKYHPDLVLLDAVMSEMDGFECCQKILEYPGSEYTPILMITGLDESRFVDLAFEVGATDYITKPIHWAVLCQRVKRLIYQSRLQKQLIEANELLAKLVITDQLTQVSNRRHFDDYLVEQWSIGIETQKSLALILCDIDYFKLYNDHYGHLAGDNCLFKIAQVLQNQLDSTAGIVARYGGEEFAVVLPNTDLALAKAIAENMRQAVADLAIPHGKSLITPKVTITLGVATLVPNYTDNPDILIKYADEALLYAKKHGRNRVCWL